MKRFIEETEKMKNLLHYSYLPGTSYVSSRQWKDADDASHQTLNYTYDSQHRLTSVKLGTGPEVSYTLNAKNQRVQMSFGDGSCWDYSYDDKGQITVMQCVSDKVGKLPYIFMHPSDILKMCQRDVMRGNYD